MLVLVLLLAVPVVATFVSRRRATSRRPRPRSWAPPRAPMPGRGTIAALAGGTAPARAHAAARPQGRASRQAAPLHGHRLGPGQPRHLELARAARRLPDARLLVPLRRPVDLRGVPARPGVELALRGRRARPLRVGAVPAQRRANGANDSLRGRVRGGLGLGSEHLALRPRAGAGAVPGRASARRATPGSRGVMPSSASLAWPQPFWAPTSSSSTALSGIVLVVDR